MQKKTSSLSKKGQLLNYRKKTPKIGCKGIAKIFKIGKTSAATIIKNEEKLCKEYASFQDNRNRNRQGKFHKLNEAMYLWYTKCCAANLYPTGALIQEVALQMKVMVEAVPELDRFHTIDGWLESLKMSYGIQETITTIAGEAGNVPITTVKAWIERLPELYGSKYSDPIAMWRSKKPCCFKNLSTI